MFGPRGEVVEETERLRLRMFQQDDLPLLCAMNADPEVMRWLGGPRPPQLTLARAEESQAAFPKVGRGMIAVDRRADGVFLGIAGLNRLDWYPDEIEVGWRLRPDFWGRGYATEAGRAWVARAFRVLGVDRVISVADVPNVRSLAVMRRLGMRLDHHARLRDGDEEFDAAVHAVTRSEWDASPGSEA
jgi:RimJ/RimL family protein N-acetyltransferase